MVHRSLIRSFTLVGLGEALFDVVGGREILGGAPLNAAFQAHQLAAVNGGEGVVVSRVGHDALGERAMAELTGRGLETSEVQIDRDAATGRAIVETKGGQTRFTIVPDVAWDRLEFTPALAALARNCDAVFYGTLGQRSPQSRDAIRQFVRHADNALRMFDVNLRAPFYNADVVSAGCDLATIVKLNEEELPIVAELVGIAAAAAKRPADELAAALRDKFRLQAVVLTRGAAGTVLYEAGRRVETAPVSYPMHPQADAVGAGDACSAGLAMGMLLGWPAELAVSLANRCGAYVASQPGATVRLPAEILDLVGAHA